MYACTDKGPQPVPAEYNIYYASWQRNLIYILETDSLTIVDSIPDVGKVVSMEVSPDGDWIYAQTYEPAYLTKIDVRSKVRVATLPYSRNRAEFLTLLRDGGLLLRGFPECKTELLDPAALTLSATLPDSVCALRGDASGTMVAALVGGTSRIRRVNIETGEMFGEYIARASGDRTLRVWDGVLHPDGKRVLAIGTRGGGIESWFVIGDLTTGETLFEHSLYFPRGSIALSGALSLSVLERRREIGVMRAIGASSWVIARLFIGEGLLLGWLSWLIALPLGLPAGQLMLRGLAAAIGFDLVYKYTPAGAIYWLFIITFLSVLASWLPARRATRISVRESLAYQ